MNKTTTTSACNPPPQFTRQEVEAYLTQSSLLDIRGIREALLFKDDRSVLEPLALSHQAPCYTRLLVLCDRSVERVRSTIQKSFPDEKQRLSVLKKYCRLYPNSLAVWRLFAEIVHQPLSSSVLPAERTLHDHAICLTRYQNRTGEFTGLSVIQQLFESKSSFSTLVGGSEWLRFLVSSVAFEYFHLLDAKKGIPSLDIDLRTLDRLVKSWQEHEDLVLIPFRYIATYLHQRELEGAQTPTVLRKQQAEQALFERLEGAIPIESLYLFAIDGSHRAIGPYAFEDEPNYCACYLEAMTQALALERVGAAEFILIQEWATKDTTRATGTRLARNSPVPVGVRRPGDKNVFFGIEDLDCSPLGIQDLDDRCQPYGPMDGQSWPGTLFTYYTEAQEIHCSSVFDLERGTAQTWLDCAFDLYERALANNLKADERLVLALALLRDAELNHIFHDGNGRSVVIALSAICHLDKDLEIPLFYDPNVFDCNGPEKLCYRVLEAMQNYRDKGTRIIQEACYDPLFLKDLKDLSPDIERLRASLEHWIPGKTWTQIHEKFAQKAHTS